MSNRPPALDDPYRAAHAWKRFRRILGAMGALGMACALAVVAYLWWLNGPMPWIFIGLTIAGVWSTVMMAALLMGLVFLSSGTGHDSAIEDRVSPQVLDEEER
jgi:hypothetical protein